MNRRMLAGKRVANRQEMRRGSTPSPADVLANAWVGELSMALAVFSEKAGSFVLTVASSGFYEILDLPPEGSVGRKFDELLPADALVNLTRAMHRSLRDNTAVGALLAGRLETQGGDRLGFVARPAAGL